MQRSFKILFVTLIAIACALSSSPATARSRKIKALIVSGQNNHNWQVSHRALRLILDQSGLFEVDTLLTPAAGGDMSKFDPKFEQYDVVLLDYNGDRWSKSTEEKFITYAKKGGGIIIYHAADNAFAQWEEYNKIIALGGWEGRNQQSGPYYYLINGIGVLDNGEGIGGSHGAQRQYPMHCRNHKHPITKGLPDDWLHARDEMYDRMRGPANIKDLLYSGYADPLTGGSGREEPLVFTVDYHKARIVHIMLGHCGESLANNPAMQCAGFQTLLLRGAEWAATGKVKQLIPADFPSAKSISMRRGYRAPQQ